MHEEDGNESMVTAEVIETERLILRPMTEADGDWIVAWRNQEETRLMTESGATFTLEEHLNWFRSSRVNRLDSMVVLKDAGLVIGTVNFKNIDWQQGVAESGRLIGDLGVRRNGYARESALAWLGYGFRRFKLQRIVGVTHRDNHANISLNQALGYELVEDRAEKAFIRMELRYEKVLTLPEWRKWIGNDAKTAGE